MSEQLEYHIHRWMYNPETYGFTCGNVSARYGMVVHHNTPVCRIVKVKTKEGKVENIHLLWMGFYSHSTRRVQNTVKEAIPWNIRTVTYISTYIDSTVPIHGIVSGLNSTKVLSKSELKVLVNALVDDLASVLGYKEDGILKSSKTNDAIKDAFSSLLAFIDRCGVQPTSKLKFQKLKAMYTMLSYKKNSPEYKSGKEAYDVCIAGEERARRREKQRAEKDIAEHTYARINASLKRASCNLKKYYPDLYQAVCNMHFDNILHYNDLSYISRCLVECMQAQRTYGYKDRNGVLRLKENSETIPATHSLAMNGCILFNALEEAGYKDVSELYDATAMLCVHNYFSNMYCRCTVDESSDLLHFTSGNIDTCSIMLYDPSVVMTEREVYTPVKWLKKWKYLPVSEEALKAIPDANAKETHPKLATYAVCTERRTKRSAPIVLRVGCHTFPAHFAIEFSKQIQAFDGNVDTLVAPLVKLVGELVAALNNVKNNNNNAN